MEKIATEEVARLRSLVHGRGWTCFWYERTMRDYDIRQRRRDLRVLWNNGHVRYWDEQDAYVLRDFSRAVPASFVYVLDRCFFEDVVLPRIAADQRCGMSYVAGNADYPHENPDPLVRRPQPPQRP